MASIFLSLWCDVVFLSSVSDFIILFISKFELLFSFFACFMTHIVFLHFFLFELTLDEVSLYLFCYIVFPISLRLPVCQSPL